MKRHTIALLTLATVASLATSISGCSSTRTAGNKLDDGTITTKIHAKLAADRDINPFNIDVDTLDGVVTLRGEVEKDSARDKAARIAAMTRGVTTVRNAIRVVSDEEKDGSRRSDAWITAKVKSKLAADPQLNPFNIDVDTQDGRVTLSGKIRTAEARLEAEKLARDTKGVTGVDNELTVAEGR